MPETSADPAGLDQRLRARGQLFETVTALGGTQARIRFTGRFQGQALIWDASLITLASLAGQSSAVTPAVPLRAFIEVGEMLATGRKLTVAVPADCIDSATALKVITMIRQYKRLCPGRHAFGPTYPTTG